MSNENVLWLTKENIENVEDVTDMAGLAGMPEMIGSGQSVGGVVTDHLPKVGVVMGSGQSVGSR